MLFVETPSLKTLSNSLMKTQKALQQCRPQCRTQRRPQRRSQYRPAIIERELKIGKIRIVGLIRNEDAHCVVDLNNALGAFRADRDRTDSVATIA